MRRYQGRCRLTATGRVKLNTSATEEQHAYILERAERLGWERQQYLSAIIDHWFKSGCPPVSIPEAALMGPTFKPQPST
jgi:hypothetical protein